GPRAQRPRELHGDRGAAGDDAEVPDVLRRRAEEGAHVDAVVVVEAAILGRDDGALDAGADLVEGQRARARAVAGADLAEEAGGAIDDADGGCGGGAELGGERRRGGGDDEGRGRSGEQRGGDREGAPPSHCFARTSNVPAAVLPHTSGVYIASTRVGGTTKRP